MTGRGLDDWMRPHDGDRYPEPARPGAGAQASEGPAATWWRRHPTTLPGIAANAVVTAVTAFLLLLALDVVEPVDALLYVPVFVAISVVVGSLRLRAGRPGR